MPCPGRPLHVDNFSAQCSNSGTPARLHESRCEFPPTSQNCKTHLHVLSHAKNSSCSGTIPAASLRALAGAPALPWGRGTLQPCGIGLPLGDGAAQGLPTKFGVNRSRVWMKKSPCTFPLAHCGHVQRGPAPPWVCSPKASPGPPAAGPVPTQQPPTHTRPQVPRGTSSSLDSAQCFIYFCLRSF